MTIFHTSPKTGMTERCRAKAACPYGTTTGTITTRDGITRTGTDGETTIFIDNYDPTQRAMTRQNQFYAALSTPENTIYATTPHDYTMTITDRNGHTMTIEYQNGYITDESEELIWEQRWDEDETNELSEHIYVDRAEAPDIEESIERFFGTDLLNFMEEDDARHHAAIIANDANLTTQDEETIMTGRITAMDTATMIVDWKNYIDGKNPEAPTLNFRGKPSPLTIENIMKYWKENNYHNN